MVLKDMTSSAGTQIAPGGIPGVDLRTNSNQRTPCVLVLDTSGSMNGVPIASLNEGLKVLEQELKGDKVASSRVQVLIIRVGGEATVEADWCDAINFSAPVLIAAGATPLGNGVDLALQKIQQHKDLLKAEGIDYTRPWLFIISDGQPTDPDWQAAAARCREAEVAKKAVVFPIGTEGEGTDFKALAQFSAKENNVFKLGGLAFKELFKWVSASTSAASGSRPGTQLTLPEQPKQLERITVDL